MAGTIIPQKNGKYKLSFMKHRQRYYKTVSASSEKEAQDLLDKFIKFIDKTVDINIELCTFEDFCNIYFKDYAPILLAEECIYNYYRTLTNWVLPKIGSTTLANCTTDFFVKYFKWLSNQISPVTNKPLAIGSREKIFGIISSVFSCAAQWRIIKKNPLPGARPDDFKRKRTSKTSRVTERCLTLEESKTLIKALNDVDLKYQLITHLALIGGLRRSEILGIKWSDVDFQNRCIHITQSSIYVPKKGYVVGNLKNEKSERTISIPRVTVILLLDYKMHTANTDNNFVFVNDKGRRKGLRLNPTSVTAWFKRFRKSINLPDEVPLHGLRHTNATLLISQGINVKSVSSRLGHSSTSITLDTYAHVLTAVDKVAGETLEKILLKRKQKLKIRKKILRKEEILQSPLSNA